MKLSGNIFDQIGPQSPMGKIKKPVETPEESLPLFEPSFFTMRGFLSDRQPAFKQEDQQLT